MKNYEKPMVLSNEDVAEGVYAASGAVDSSEAGTAGGAASVSKVELTQPGNEYYRVNTYDITIKNNGSEDLTGWSASVSVTSGTATGATTYNTWLASVSYGNGVITITPGQGQTVIGASQEIKVSVAVSYSGDGITVE